MERTRLILHGVSEIVGAEDLGILILSDERKERQLTIICEKSMAVQIEARLHGHPISRHLLPEVLLSVIHSLSDVQWEIYIDSIIDGQYHAVLTGVDWHDSWLIRASDAVLLAIAGNIPIYIDTNLMRRQSVKIHNMSQRVALPINTLNDEMLAKALEQAVQDENYELASQLRDERRRRHKHTN